MKTYVRILALVLALVMTVALFVGCGGQEENTEPKDNTTEAPTQDEFYPDIERNNYGKEFYLATLPDVNPPGFYWVNESDNTVLSDAIYERQENVRKYLGVEIVGSNTDGESRYIQPFQNAVKNKDGSVDMLLSHVYYGIESFISGGYLTDFQDMPELDLYADYWKYDFMEEISANGHMYLGFNDFNIFYTHVVTFNKELLSRYEDQLDESIYDTVTNYRWTLDKMISLANLVSIDTLSDGKTEDDTFGFVSEMGIGYAGLLQASGIQLVSQDEKGDYTLSIFNETNKAKMDSLVKKLKDFVSSEYAFTANKLSESAPKMNTGRALMSINGTYWLSDLLDYDLDFGVLPYPMYDESQKEYRHLQWGGYICVPSYLSDPTMTGETIEMLAFFSDPVNIAFYEKMLGKQVADVPLDRKMLDLVWDGVCSDLGQTYYSVIYDNTNKYLYCLCMLTEEGTTKNLSSYVAGIQTSYNNKLKRFFKGVK